MNNDINNSIKICIICLENENENENDNNNKLIEYNHCGKYYIHNYCLNGWKKNECIICREKFFSNIKTELNNELEREITIRPIQEYYFNNENKKYCLNLIIFIYLSGTIYYFLNNFIIN